VLDGDLARQLLDSIDVSTIVGLRDRALIALLVSAFARVSAALHMNVKDYYPQGKLWWMRLHEKSGKQPKCQRTPCSNIISTPLGARRQTESGQLDKVSPLFRTLGGRAKSLTNARMARQYARRMIVRRAVRPALSRALAVTRFGRPGSPSIYSTAGCSNTCSKRRRTRARAQPSFTTGATTWSLSIRWSGLSY
jgi:integrase/recombinase XerD